MRTVLIYIFAFVFGVVLSPVLQAANASAERRVHVVSKGDTLSSIAQRHYTTVAEIKAANGLKNDVIIIGQTLKLPVVKAIAVHGPSSENGELEQRPKRTPEKPTQDTGEPAVRTLRLEQQLEAFNPTDRFRLQVYLDGIGFAAGKVDGLAGEFTVKAVRRWIDAAPGRDLEMLFDAARHAVKTPITQFEIPDEAAKFVGVVPDELEERASAKTLPYTAITEYVAERFHTDEATLGRLNDGLKERDYTVGATVKVPAVKPFYIENSRTGTATKERITGASLRILHLDHLLEVRDSGGKVVAVFPITVGSKPEYVRAGAWKVVSVIPNPTFVWDEEMLKHGRKGSKQYILPPGPNNPVGIFWLELQPVAGPEAHIGIHGTNDPTHIGRNHSSGCIRLANWDIVRLSRMIGAGTRVVWEPQPEGAKVADARD